MEQTVKSLNEEHAALEDKYTKLEKEKKSIESRLADLSTHLTDEEERSKQLMKLKSKYESSITELEDKLSKEQASRQDLERAKRRLETEVSEKAEQGADSMRLIDELKQQIANIEAELSKTQQKLDEEVLAKTVSMKQVSLFVCGLTHLYTLSEMILVLRYNNSGNRTSRWFFLQAVDGFLKA